MKDYIQYYQYNGINPVLCGWLPVNRIVKIIPVSINLKATDNGNGEKVNQKEETVWHPGAIIEGGEAVVLLKANFRFRDQCLDFMDKKLDILN